MKRPILIPVVATPALATHETYTLCHHAIRATVSIDNWQYCTEFTTPIDAEKLCLLYPQRATERLRHHTLVDNILIEEHSHSIEAIGRHLRATLAELSTITPKNDTAQIGRRDCLDVHSTSLVNGQRINLNRLIELYPYAKPITSGRGDAVCIDMALLMENEELLDGTSVLKFSPTEYTRLCENEKAHRAHDEFLIESRLELLHTNEQDVSTVERAKACILGTGQVIMTGPTNRRATINAHYNVLQMIASCVY